MSRRASIAIEPTVVGLGEKSFKIKVLRRLESPILEFDFANTVSYDGVILLVFEAECTDTSNQFSSVSYIKIPLHAIYTNQLKFTFKQPVLTHAYSTILHMQDLIHQHSKANRLVHFLQVNSYPHTKNEVRTKVVML